MGAAGSRALERRLQGSETKVRVLLGGARENNILLDEKSLICLSSKSMIFIYKKETYKNELVARPGRHCLEFSHRFS